MTHAELQQAYLELQARVTRFSATEQALINAHDRLDQERLVYKLMNDFHSAAIEVKDVPSLLSLISETLVELFETEWGYASFRCAMHPERSASHLEGGHRGEASELEAALRNVVQQSAEGPENRILEDAACTGVIQRGFVARRNKKQPESELVVVGGVSQRMSENYAPFGDNTTSLLKLFVDSCSSYLDNLTYAGRIQMQLETIRQSELEQRKLSLIATNTSSGAIITDAHGRIQWVNSAFVESTGYTMEEAVGQRPKDMLQWEGDNDPEVLLRLSNALWSQTGISVGLKNRRKNGEPFYINLNITPVHDEHHQLINFIAIQQDITEQKLAEQRILEQNDALKKINQELDHFVYSISHDLRTPLLSIQGLLGLIDPNGNSEEDHQYLGLIEESVKRLDNTILDILNYSRNARLDVVHDHFDLKQTIEDVVQDLSSLRPDVRTCVDWNGPSEVHLDEVRVGVVLKNILSNALKYSKSGQDDAAVQVKVDNRPGHCTITVSDNGEGIPEDLQPRVFDMFFRATNSSSGTGLGLYICKEVVDKLGGTISLTSTPNEGTEVRVELPQIPTAS